LVTECQSQRAGSGTRNQCACPPTIRRLTAHPGTMIMTNAPATIQATAFSEALEALWRRTAPRSAGRTRFPRPDSRRSRLRRACRHHHPNHNMCRVGEPICIRSARTMSAAGTKSTPGRRSAPESAPPSPGAARALAAPLSQTGQLGGLRAAIPLLGRGRQDLCRTGMSHVKFRNLAQRYPHCGC